MRAHVCVRAADARVPSRAHACAPRRRLPTSPTLQVQDDYIMVQVAGDFFSRAYPVMRERLCAGRSQLSFKHANYYDFEQGEDDVPSMRAQDAAGLMAGAWGRLPENLRAALLAIE